MDSVQSDTRLCTVGAAKDSTCEPEAGANTMKCTLVDDLMGDRSTRCPKKSGRTSAEVLRAEANLLWHSGLPISSRLEFIRNHMEPCMSQNWPVGIQAMLMCCVYLGGRVRKYLRKIHCSRA